MSLRAAGSNHVACLLQIVAEQQSMLALKPTRLVMPPQAHIPAAPSCLPRLQGTAISNATDDADLFLIYAVHDQMTLQRSARTISLPTGTY